MQLKKITLACAAALAVSPAFAVFDPADVGTAYKIILSGATAPDGFVKSAATEMLKPGYKSYRNSDLSQAFQYRAWFGAAVAGIPGVAENTPILVVKRSQGGSVWGVDPVARASRIKSLNFSACGDEGSYSADGTTYSYLCGVKGLDPDSLSFTDPALNNGDISDYGVSDVSPALFKGPYNVEFGQGQLLDAEVAALDIKPVNTVMMGIVATNDVPLTTRIGRADYANMLAGNVYDWTQVDPLASGNTQVVVCRRVNGSGTQASYNWFFNNFPCQSAFNGAVAPASMENSDSGITGGDGSVGNPFTIDPTGGYTVVNNSTSGDVRNCLIKAQAHQDHTITGDDGKTYTIQFGNSGNPFKAIGVLSLDSYTASGSSTSTGEGGSWTYRMMDGAGSYQPGTDIASAGATGIAPSKANLLSGAYEFAVELTMQYRNKTVVNPQGDTVLKLGHTVIDPAFPLVPVDPQSATKKAFVDEMIKRSGDPAKIALNSKVKVYAALPDFYSAITTPAQVAKGSHKGNMCKPLIRKY